MAEDMTWSCLDNACPTFLHDVRFVLYERIPYGHNIFGQIVTFLQRDREIY